MTGRAIVSIHDVQPSTLPGVLEVVDLLQTFEVCPVTLLVVPGVPWDRISLDTVRELVDRGGYGIAGHGWSHAAPPPSGWYHRLHAFFFSRDQAEHLSRGRGEVADLVERCHGWFGGVGLPSPELYVPPAWALGRLSRADLAGLPFRWYETLGGCISAADGRLSAMPLVGFEADSRLRDIALRATNMLNLWVGTGTKRPLRVAIHPWDLRYRLSAAVRDTVRRMLAGGWSFTTIEAAMAETRDLRDGPREARTG